MKSLLVAVSFFLALLAPSLSMADANLASGDAWTVYATANGQALQAIFEAIKGITQDDSYLYLITFVSLLAFIGYAVMATFDARKIEGFLGVLVVIVVVTQVGLRQKADVVVHDPFYGTTYVSQDVPAGVAIPIAVISTVGQNVTVMLETYFSTPASLQVSNTGTINMASSLIADASRMSIQDSGLRGSMTHFAKDCIVPSIAAGRLSGSMLTESPQLFGPSGTLRAVNPGIITTVYANQSGVSYPLKVYCGPNHDGDGAVTATHDNFYGQTVTSDNAYEYISELIEVGAPRALAQGRGVAYGTPAYTWLTGALSSAQTHLSDNVLTASGEDSVRQAAAANMLTDGLSSAVASTGDSALTSSVAFAQAIKGQESSWVMAAAIFNDISGYIFSLLQALMIGLMPIIIVAAFVPGTKMKILVSVLQIFLWLALWQPTFAILNFIITEYAQGPFGGIINDSNYSMMTAPIVATTTDRFITAAGFMGASIPMITWGIVKGGMALTSFVSGALGGSFANAAANMAATGNVSLGNQSYDNFSANSQNFSGRIESGTPTATTNASAIGGETTNVDGSVTKSNLLSQEGSKSIQEQQKFAEQQSAKLQSQVQNSVGDAQTVANATIGAHQISKGENGQYQTSNSNGETYSESEMVEKMLQSGQSKNSTESVEEQQERATQVGVSAGMSVNGGALSKLVGGFMKTKQFSGLSGGKQDQIAALKAGLDMGNTLRGKDSESAAAQIAEGVTTSFTDRDGNQKQITTSASEVYQGVLSNAEMFSTTDSTSSQDTAEAKRNVADAYSSSNQIEQSIERSAAESQKQTRSTMPGMTETMGAIKNGSAAPANFGMFGRSLSQDAEQGRRNLAGEAQGAGLTSAGVGAQLDNRMAPPSGQDVRGAIVEGQADIGERAEAGQQSVDQTSQARQADHEKDADRKNDARRAMAGDVQDKVAEKQERIGEDANGGLFNIDERFNDGELKSAIAGMFGASVLTNAAQGAAQGAATKKAADLAGNGDGPDGTKRTVSADSPDAKGGMRQKAKNFVDQIGDKITPDSVKKFQGAIDRMDADDTKSFKSLLDNPKFQKFAGEAGVDKAMDSIGKKLGVAAGAQVIPVGGQIVGGLMVAGAAYDAYQTFDMMTDVLDQYSRNGADGVDYNAIKQEHMGADSGASPSYYNGGRSFGTGGQVPNSEGTVFSQEGRSNMAAGNSLTPDRSSSEVQSIIDQMDAGSQEFARTHLSNDPNSTLLNTGDSGRTVLEEIRSGDISPDEAAAQYSIAPGAINAVAAPIGGNQ